MPESLEIRGRRVVLRDVCPEDVEDQVRWRTSETAWLEWDAPWEADAAADPEAIRKKWADYLARPRPERRAVLEVCLLDGRHVGSVNLYPIDGDRERLGLGIDIRERELWGRGLGSEAFPLWVAYVFQSWERKRLHCETWSGNTRMIRLAVSCGFRETSRKPAYHEVRGEPVNGLGFIVGREEFERLHAAAVDAVDRALVAEET